MELSAKMTKQHYHFLNTSPLLNNDLIKYMPALAHLENNSLVTPDFLYYFLKT